MNPIKPCIRCEGKGVVAIEVIGPDPHDHTVIGTAKCHGCGGTDKTPVMPPSEVERILGGNSGPKDAS
jgi:hypothetical protein